MDGDIDKVMSGLDRIVEAAPSYEKLFMRWQRQHWSTEDFTFEEDAKQWADPDFFTEEERRFIKFGFSQFFLGEERVTVELLPFALATPQHMQQIFLTTQISDEAKHVVFWDGFYREVFGEEAGRPRRAARQPALRRQRRLAEAVRRHPPRVPPRTCARIRATSPRWSAASPST